MNNQSELLKRICTLRGEANEIIENLHWDRAFWSERDEELYSISQENFKLSDELENNLDVSSLGWEIEWAVKHGGIEKLNELLAH